MKRLASYLKPYWKAALLAPLLMIVEVVADLLQPTFMARIVDHGIAGGDMGFILRTGALMIGITLIGMAGGVGCTVFASVASQKFSADLRNDLFQKVQSFSFENLDTFKTASLITRLTNDVVQLQNVVLAMLRIMVRAPLMGLGGIILALMINPGLAAILLVIMPLLILALTGVIRKGFPLFNQVQQRLDRVNTVIRENLAGVRVVKAFVRSDYEKRRFGDANEALTAIATKASRLVGLTMPLMFLLMNLGVIAVVWFGGVRVNSGNMQVGQVMAFINYMVQILFSLMMVAFMLMAISRAKASADRILEVLAAEAPIRDPARPAAQAIRQGRIDFQNVSFRYRGGGGAAVLRDLDLTVLPGQTTAILGATGSGKSTLVNLIPRFYDVTAGRVLVDGTDVRDYPLEALRQAIGMVLQESVLFSGTILENIRWGRPEASEAEVRAAAEAAQAHEFISQLPDGYGTVLGQRGVNLSGGQKQRLAIARALLRRPAILILDDSTSAVDLRTEARIQQALKAMSGVTCLVIAQRISSVIDADQILVLDDGRIVARGTHRELLQSCALYQDIYQSQLGEEAV
ncbi:ATP-binding cassette subfamily B protein [Hydrogenispora ethanolica]|uniref:ATP-binding cassette subfamily B protein n=1 Tax=Hydrogenispora ethanolica TaxID=1082276 RepID=A0A4R1R1R1_HYDET|nr:ABC transporter ATP-binding protein [Hydrogenispora ethanolica]TCL59232.1 ATP-binding cassette subfamily B protein [Hydrogenispora ethanolica]